MTYHHQIDAVTETHKKMAPNTVLRSASPTGFVMSMLLGHIHAVVEVNLPTLPFECGPTDCHEHDCCYKENQDKIYKLRLLNRPLSV